MKEESSEETSGHHAADIVFCDSQNPGGCKGQKTNHPPPTQVVVLLYCKDLPPDPEDLGVEVGFCLDPKVAFERNSFDFKGVIAFWSVTFLTAALWDLPRHLVRNPMLLKSSRSFQIAGCSG